MLWKSKISYIALCAIALTSCRPDPDPEPEPDPDIDTFSDEKYAVYMAFSYDSIPSASAKSILCS